MASVLKFKVAAPCNARWDDMSGNDSRRFCSQCDKHVYNFSRMSTEEISEVTGEAERVCARFYQRSDGTILMDNCPVGTEGAMKRIKVIATSFVALLLVSAGALLASTRSATRTQHQARLEALWDDATWKIKGLLGMQPPVLVMGEISIPPSTSNATTPKPNQ